MVSSIAPFRACLYTLRTKMLSLFASIAILAMGPLLHGVMRQRRAALPVLDGFIFVAIGGLVLQHTVVESFNVAGWPVIPVALIGFLGPTVGEKVLHRAAEQVHRAALALAMLGLAFHAALDGMALARPEAGVGALALAVILHRIPVSLTIWILLRPPYGVLAAAGALGVVALATTVGFYAGRPLLGDGHGGVGVGLFQALVAGSLLHVVVHRSPLLPEGSGWRLYEGLGALAGAVLLWALVAMGSHEGHQHEAGGHGKALLEYGVPLGLAAVAVCLPRRKHDHQH